MIIADGPPRSATLILLANRFRTYGRVHARAVLLRTKVGARDAKAPPTRTACATSGRDSLFRNGVEVAHAVRVGGAFASLAPLQETYRGSTISEDRRRA